jgi:hypothetical protein
MLAPTMKSKNPVMNIPKHVQSVHDIGLPRNTNSIKPLIYRLTFNLSKRIIAGAKIDE